MSNLERSKDTMINTVISGGEERSQSKKRRIPGACDICKRKKSDSGQMPDNRCSNCVQFGYDCTHKEVMKTLGSAKGYVESLEARLEKMDKLLSKLMPGIDINQEVDKIDSRDSSEPELLPRNDDDPPSPMLTMQLQRLILNPDQNRFFGRSSGYQLVQTALDLKQEYIGPEKAARPPNGSFKRREFWDVPPWISNNPEMDEEPPNYVYPEEDLMYALIDHYFEEINPFFPLLHRPTFERHIRENLHQQESMFGAVLLLVCAHGARFSEDPRVLAEGSTSPRSAGWRWFEQVNVLRKNLFKRTTLHELQMHALHVSFAQSSEMPQGIWAQIGLATRLSQEVGAHRRRRKEGTPPTAEDELWKRAFWVIVSLDRNLSSVSGRPCGLQDEDLDVDLPLECDDEYWEHGFKQPAGKPSSISFFNAYLRLMDILAYAMRLIYSIKHPNHQFGQGAARSDQQIIAELDSAMNNWMDVVPSHLRWNPACENKLFLKQSAGLHATYYHLQIFIHRPFIPSPRNPLPVSFPSLAICTNAARSCCHVLEAFHRMAALPLAEFQTTAFVSGLILLLNIWSGKRSGYAPNPKREMEDVQRCMEILKSSERRWAKAGRYWDILRELAYAGDLSISIPQSPTSNSARKRSRESDEREEHVSPTASVPVTFPGQTRNIAGSRRVSTSQSAMDFQQQQRSPAQLPTLFSLPMYGQELGRLPIYGQFNFSDSLQTHIPIQPNTQLPANLDQLIILSNLLSGNPEGVASSSSGGVGYSSVPLTGHNAPFTDARIGLDKRDGNTYGNGDLFPLPDDFDFRSSQAENFIASTVGSQGQATWPGFSNEVPAMDDDTLRVWSTAPRNLEVDEWNSYISSVEQMTQAQGHPTTFNF